MRSVGEKLGGFQSTKQIKGIFDLQIFSIRGENLDSFPSILIPVCRDPDPNWEDSM
jgi:hypothetical protein